MKLPPPETLVSVVLAGLLGYALRAQLERGPSPEHLSSAACDIDWLRMRGELHTVVRDTLVTTLHAEEQRRGLSLTQAVAAKPASDTGPVPASASASPAQAQAWRDHAALLAEARQRGAWTDADVARSRQLVAAMEPEARASALAAVAAAINSSQLKITAGRPF